MIGGRALTAAIIVLAALLFLIAATGGIDVHLGDLHLRIRSWTRPFALLTAVLAFRVWTLRRSHRLSASIAMCGMLALLVAAAGVYVHYHVRVAGGLDGYGYVSTALLIASGRLSEPQPLAAVLPFDTALQAATPIGHVAGPDGTSVPRFPLGFPLVMALFTMFGSNGPFYVPLVMAYAAIALAYFIARQWGSDVTGLFAATLVAIDPLFVTQAIQPMSDVPATCWLLAAVAAVRQADKCVKPLLWSCLGGLCGGMALLTCPALIPAVGALALIASKRRVAQPTARPAGSLTPRPAETHALQHTYAFAAVALGFLLVQTALNVKLYGSPTESGYGTMSHMFELSLSRLTHAVSTFGRGLTYSHTWLFWLLWPGAMIVLRRERWAWQVSAVAAAATAPYLFYIVFDGWEFSRFLLPSIVLVLILAACALDHLFRASPSAAHTYPMFVLAIAILLAIGSHRFLQRENIPGRADLESKYPLVGDWFRANTSERVVVLASLHSGSVRFYGNRQTVRWDEIPGTALTVTLRNLIASGYEPFLVLDVPGEPPLFYERFAVQPLNMEQLARVKVANIYKFVSAY